MIYTMIIDMMLHITITKKYWVTHTHGLSVKYICTEA